MKRKIEFGLDNYISCPINEPVLLSELPAGKPFREISPGRRAVLLAWREGRLQDQFAGPVDVTTVLLSVNWSKTFAERASPFELRLNDPFAGGIDVTPSVIARPRFRCGCEPLCEWIRKCELGWNCELARFVDVSGLAVQLDLRQPIMKTIVCSIAADVALFAVPLFVVRRDHNRSRLVDKSPAAVNAKTAA